MAGEVDRKKFPHEDKECFYSDLKVMRSPAGHYLGRSCWDKELGFEEPFSRESDYFKTKEAAELALQAGFQVRECVENELAYETGGLAAPHQPEHN